MGAVVASSGVASGCGLNSGGLLCCHAAEAERWRLEAKRQQEENGRIRVLLKTAQERVQELTTAIEALKVRLATLTLEHFGRSSERQVPEAEAEAPPNDAAPAGAKAATGGCGAGRLGRGQRHGARGHGRRQYGHLPSVDVPHTLREDQSRCDSCGAAFKPIGGPKTSQEIDIRVVTTCLVHKRQRYQRTCNCPGTPEITTAPGPPKLIRKGLFSTAAITWLLAEKFQWARPLHRTTQGLQQLTAAHLAEGSLTGVFEQVQPLLHPLAEAIRDHSLTAGFAQHDETSWPVRLANGRRGKGWLWYTGTADTECYEVADSRSSALLDRRYAQAAQADDSGAEPAGRPRATLSDFYAVYRLLGERYGLIVAYCWSHMRRYFLRVAAACPHLREWSQGWVLAIKELYRLDDERRGAPPSTPAWATADAALRRHVEHLQVMAESQCFSPQERDPQVQKVLFTLLTHWDGLTAFLDRPEIPLDNNGSERSLRNPVVCRKNFYGSGAAWSGALAGDFWTVYGTARLAGLNPVTLLYAFFDATARNGSRPLGPEQLRRFLPWAMTDDDRAAWSRPLWGDSS